METIVVVAALSLSLILFVRRARRPPLPPGPKSSWFGFGRPPVPEMFPWKTYEKWQKTYGDLNFYYAFGSPVAIINSRKVADDLLEKRGAIYSSRPTRTMMGDLMGWSWSFGGMAYGDRWKKYRGTFQKHFRSSTVARYEPIQLKEVQTLLLNLKRTPEDFAHHMRRNAAALVMKINYDHDIADEGDVYVDLAEKAMASVGKAAIHGTYAVDYLPILKYIPSWFPGALFKRQAKEWRKLSEAMLQKPFEMVKQKMASGMAGPCVTTMEIEEGAQQKDFDVTMTQGIAAVSYAAGADTTVAGVISFFLAMMTHPDIQRQAQAEIDRVVGTDRLPNFEDRNRLPFVTCITWEILRWNPIAPIGVAHATVQDDVYEGYWIPKGTSLIPNIWRMFHDEAKYPDPYKFDPRRFEDEAKNAELGINELPLMTFGFGRRICPGRWLALDTIWITVASVLAVYNISKPKDENGVDIEQDVKYAGTVVSRPEPFKCLFVPRSKEALDLITQGGGQRAA